MDNLEVYNCFLSNQQKQYNELLLNGKSCTKCGTFKPYTEFHKLVKSSDGHMNRCRPCRNEEAREYRKTPEYHENIIKYINKPEVKEVRKENMKRFNQTEKAKNNRNTYQRNRYNTDTNFRLSMNLRNRINSALKGNSKSDHTMNLIGCSSDFLKTFLEFQFYDGMSWENQGWY